MWDFQSNFQNYFQKAVPVTLEMMEGDLINPAGSLLSHRLFKYKSTDFSLQMTTSLSQGLIWRLLK